MVGSVPGHLATPSPAVAFLESALILETGATFGDVMASWQRAFFDAVFATERSGKPTHRLVYDERRRGESKTEDLAACALADLATGPDRHRSYAVAADQDQASLILDSVRGFAHRSPMLAGLEVQRMTVRNPVTGSELRVMSSDDRTAYGIRPRRVYFDELSLQTDERLWNAMWSAVGKSPYSQMVAVSMAGWDFASLGWKIRELASSTPTYYFATRENTELAPWLSPANMREQEATLHPADFARFWECRWTEPKGSWITREMYDQAENGKPSLRGDGKSTYAGFVDVGLIHDPTAIAVVSRHDDTVVLDEMRTLQGSKTHPVDLEVVEDEVIELTRRFGVKHWVFEAPQAAASVQRLQTRLPHVTVELRYPSADSMGRLFGGLYRLFANRQLSIFPHDQLRREALSLAVKTTAGRMKVVESSAIHQDHVVALGGAADVVLNMEPEPDAWAAFISDDGSVEIFDRNTVPKKDGWLTDPAAEFLASVEARRVARQKEIDSQNRNRP